MFKSKPPSCTTCKQLNCLINKCCSPKWKSYLENNKLFIAYPPKKTVFLEGEIVSGVYFIHKGKTKVYNTGKKSKQNIIRLADSGEMIGLRSFDEKQYSVSVATLEDSFLCYFEKQIFHKTLEDSPQFVQHLLEFYANKLSEIEMRHRNFSQWTNKEKIAASLLILKSQFGVMSDNNEWLLDIALSRQEMADFAGTGVEDLIRTLTFLQKEQIIKKSNQKIILSNPDKLYKLLLENNYDNEIRSDVLDCLPN